MSDSVVPKTPDKKPETQFTTENIGRWAAKQENPFAEQNRKTAAKKQKRVEARKKATPYVAITAGVIATGLAIFGLVMIIIALVNSQPKLPDDITLGSEGAAEISEAAQNVYQEQLQNFYNKHGGSATGSVEDPSEEAVQEAVNAVSDYYNEQKDKTSDEVKKTQLAILEMQTYAKQGMSGEVVRIGQTINEDNISAQSWNTYCEMMGNSYFNLGDIEVAYEYLSKMTNVVTEGN